MTGIARDETFGRNFLGNTVEKAIRHTPVPVLVVKTRPHGPYRNIVVGTDFSDPSREALDAAIGLFPDATFTLMHAFHVPFEGLSPTAGRSIWPRTARTCGGAQKRSCPGCTMPDATRAAMKLVIEHGAPSELLETLVETQPVDLVVLGSHRHGDLFNILFGSTAEYLLSVLSCDILVVRETRTATARRADPTPPGSPRSGHAEAIVVAGPPPQQPKAWSYRCPPQPSRVTQSGWSRSDHAPGCDRHATPGTRCRRTAVLETLQTHPGGLSDEEVGAGWRPTAPTGCRSRPGAVRWCGSCCSSTTC